MTRRVGWKIAQEVQRWGSEERRLGDGGCGGSLEEETEEERGGERRREMKKKWRSKRWRVGFEKRRGTRSREREGGEEEEEKENRIGSYRQKREDRVGHICDGQELRVLRTGVS